MDNDAVYDVMKHTIHKSITMQYAQQKSAIAIYVNKGWRNHVQIIILKTRGKS